MKTLVDVNLYIMKQLSSNSNLRDWVALRNWQPMKSTVYNVVLLQREEFDG